jgi:hypothetical protein
MIKNDKKYKKIYKIIIWIIFLLSFFWNNTFAYDDEQYYNFSWLSDLWTWTTNFYLWDVSATQNYNLYVVYESFDCEVLNDFAFTINWLTGSIPCTWSWDGIYKLEFWNFTNLTANTVYEMYLTQYTVDTWGLWQLDLYIEYIQDTTPTETINTDYENIYFWKRFTLFSDVEDLRTFFQVQVWVLLFIYISIMILKIFIYKRS